MANYSIKGYLDFWGNNISKLKDLATDAYGRLTYPEIKNPLVKDLGDRVNTVPVLPTSTPTPTPPAYPTMGPDFQFQVQDKPPIPPNLMDMVNRAASSRGIDPEVNGSLLAQESGGYNYDLPPEKRIGDSGERGITQIIPEYHYEEAGYKTPEEYGLALDNGDEFAIKESARILKKYYTGRKNIFDALREYNSGGELVNGTQYAIEVLKRVGLEDEIPEEYKKMAGTSKPKKP